MLKAVLFDLDDTLLGNPMDTFLPAYFRALQAYLEDLIPPDRLMAELMKATEAMNRRRHANCTNEEAFAAVFYPALGVERTRVETVFERFYAEEFPRLQVLTERRPAARDLVEWSFDKGFQVAVATNPLFPRGPVEQRLAWAGVPTDEFDFDLVTTYETMHATKSDISYYLEILDRLGRDPDDCLMVGDSWEMDVAPASSLGMHAYWVTEENAPPDPEIALAGRGSLEELWRTVATCDALPTASA
jgi:FMN phosphatase YigB (HAD superfamily)